MKRGGAKVLALALDAADKDLLCAWAAEGILPTFRRLLNDSPSVITTSPPGVYPGAVWGSLITGTGPDHHGRYSTHQIQKGTYRLYGFTPNHFRRRPFWEALSAAGKRVAIVDVPKSPPCDTLNGVLVLEWGTHDFDLGFQTHPASLQREILAGIGPDPVGPCDQRTLRTADQLAEFREALLTRITRKTTLLRRLLAEERWDFFMAAFGESHCSGHQCWSVHDPSHPDHDPDIARRVGDILRDVYVALDRAIGDVLDTAGETERTFVLTSHGFGPHYNASHMLDDVLRRLEGAPPPRRPPLSYRMLRGAWRQLPRTWRVRLGKAAHQVVDQLSEPLDQRRRFFAVPNNFVSGAIRINLAGREPQGLVQPGTEYDAVCAEIERDLRALVNPETGRPAVLRVWRTSEIYDGPLLDEMPDLIVEWDRRAPIRTLESQKTGRIDKPYAGGRSGDHRPEGLCLIRGTGFPAGQRPETISITRLAPTFAALLGVPLPDVRAEPLSWCLESN